MTPRCDGEVDVETRKVKGWKDCGDPACPTSQVDVARLLWAVLPGVLLVAFAVYVVIADALLLAR